MKPPVDLAIVLLARDRFSTVESSLQMALADVAQSGLKSRVYIADSGYSADHIRSLESIARSSETDKNFVIVGKYANTNHAWNEALRYVTEQNILCLENDVNLQQGCLAALLPLITNESNYDIAVPAVYEANGATPHFRPAVASIDRLQGGGRQINLDRGRTEKRSTQRITGSIAIFERHCFLITRKAALALGDWDELMFCRTDLDLSLACHVAGLHIAFVESATVQLSGEVLKQEDVDFYDYRWNEHRVTRANERLIAKWQLVGYKRTVDHVKDARKRLSSFGLS